MPLHRLAVGRRRGLRDQVVGGAADDRLVERVLVAEVVVEQAAGDARLLGEQVDRELVERAVREQPDPEVEQLLAALLRGQADPWRRTLAHTQHSIDTFSIAPLPSRTCRSNTSSSAPASPGCARRSSSRRTARPTSSWSRRAPTSAAPGATTPTRAPPATCRASSTRSRSPPTGTGRGPSPPSRRSRPTSSGSPRESGTLDRFAFETSLEDARWDEDAQVWRSRISGPDGEREVTSTTLVVGAGSLSEPKLPDIDGIDTFQGRPLPLLALGPRRGPGRQAGRGHRHRRLGDPDRARGSAGRRPPRRLPAHRALGDPARRPALHAARAAPVQAAPRLPAALPDLDLPLARDARAGPHREPRVLRCR